MGRVTAWLRRLDCGPSRRRADLGDEAQAYLEGRLLERLGTTRLRPQAPAWLWLNPVAHGDVAVVRAAAEFEAGDPATQPAPLTWRAAQAGLAQELLACAGGEEAVLRSLQSRVLAPLETSVCNSPDLTPSQFLDVLATRLRHATR